MIVLIWVVWLFAICCMLIVCVIVILLFCFPLLCCFAFSLVEWVVLVGFVAAYYCYVACWLFGVLIVVIMLVIVLG